MSPEKKKKGQAASWEQPLHQRGQNALQVRRPAPRHRLLHRRNFGLPASSFLSCPFRTGTNFLFIPLSRVQAPQVLPSPPPPALFCHLGRWPRVRVAQRKDTDGSSGETGRGRTGLRAASPERRGFREHISRGKSFLCQTSDHVAPWRSQPAIRSDRRARTWGRASHLLSWPRGASGGWSIEGTNPRGRIPPTGLSRGGVDCETASRRGSRGCGRRWAGQREARGEGSGRRGSRGGRAREAGLPEVGARGAESPGVEAREALGSGSRRAGF